MEIGEEKIEVGRDGGALKIWNGDSFCNGSLNNVREESWQVHFNKHSYTYSNESTTTKLVTFFLFAGRWKLLELKCSCKELFSLFPRQITVWYIWNFKIYEKEWNLKIRLWSVFETDKSLTHALVTLDSWCKRVWATVHDKIQIRFD